MTEFYDSTGLRELGAGTFRTSIGDFIEPEEHRKRKATGRKRQSAGDHSRQVEYGLPESASPEARLMAGYPPHRQPKRKRAKVTPDDVRMMRDMHPRLSQRSLAKMFGITQSMVGRIVRGESWAWVA